MTTLEITVGADWTLIAQNPAMIQFFDNCNMALGAIPTNGEGFFMQTYAIHTTGTATDIYAKAINDRAKIVICEAD